MARAWKAGAAAVGLALLAVLGWTVFGRTADRPEGPAPAAPAPAAAPGLATAPPKPVAPVAKPPAEDVPAHVPLDAPIPWGEGSIAGRIRFTDGTPFAHARIGLVTGGGVTETDEEGRFHIHGEQQVGPRGLAALGPNDYVLDLAPVRLKANERVTVDVTIERGYALEGRVVDALTKTPVAAARVSLCRSGEGLAQAWNGGVKTDADGRFRLELLPAAAYILAVVAPGYLTFVWEGEIRSTPAPLDVRLGASMPLVLKYVDAPAAAVGTTVRWEWRGNGFNQGGSGALAGAGEVHGDTPPPGGYTLAVQANEALPAFQQTVAVRAGEPVTVTLKVPPSRAVSGRLRDAEGKPMGNVRVRVGEGDLPPVTTGPQGDFLVPRVLLGRRGVWILFDDGSVRIGRVDGQATEFDWRAVAVGEVSATIPGAVRVTVYDPHDVDRRVAEAKPDRTGRVRIPFLAAGSYRLHAFGGGATDDQERAFDLLPGQSLDLGDIRLSRLPVVPVMVTFPPQVKDRTTLLVLIVREPGEPPMLSGRIEFEADGKAWLKGLPAGEWKVLVEAKGCAPLETTIGVRDGITSPIPIELRAR